MKLTPDMLAKAVKSGAHVEAPKPVRAKRAKKVAAAPPPVVPPTKIDTRGLEQSIADLVGALQNQVASMQLQIDAYEIQNQELRLVVKAVSEKNPVRMKIQRDMDRNSPTYLLLQHIDTVPVEYRRLNS
jgi:hypothetical protein